MKKLMIYGATGYTGRMAAERASAAGTPLILAGRTEAALVSLAANGYTFTAIAGAEAGRRVLAGEARPGFQTPAMLFGNGFAASIADTIIIDL
jgi:short subunit dehydrogenase-like uncharacterized protein